jgi:molecular chaperone DnaK
VSTPIIERNSTIPIKASKVFSTADDYQTSVTINVIQGERPLARDNISLGSFNLEGIPPAPRGVPQIEVTFDIDANGILSVSAKDKATGKTQKITISAPHKLSKEEIEKMMQAAKENEENDKKIKELIEAKNNISALSYSLEKTLNDFKDKITDEEKNEADEIIKKIKEDTAKEDVTLDQINEDKDKLTAVINKLSSKIYSQKDQSAPGAEQQGPQNDENNGTQDGEGNSES